MDLAALIAARDAAQRTVDSLTTAINNAGVKRMDIRDFSWADLFDSGSILVLEIEEVDEDTALAVATEWYGDSAEGEIEGEKVLRCYIVPADADTIRMETSDDIVEGGSKPYLYSMERDLRDVRDDW